MICAGRPLSPASRLRCALESLFGASATDDLLALAEAQAGFLDTQRLPEGLEALVDSLICACTDVSRPSESCCQSTWRSSESCSISVWS